MSDYLWIPGTTDNEPEGIYGIVILDAWAEETLRVEYRTREEALNGMVFLARSYLQESAGLGGRIIGMIQNRLDEISTWLAKAVENGSASNVEMYTKQLQAVEQQLVQAQIAEDYLERFGDALTVDSPLPEDPRIDSMFDAPEDRNVLNFLVVLLLDGYRVYLYCLNSDD